LYGLYFYESACVSKPRRLLCRKLIDLRQPVLISSFLASNLRMMSNRNPGVYTLQRLYDGTDVDNPTSIFMPKIHKEVWLVLLTSVRYHSVTSRPVIFSLVVSVTSVNTGEEYRETSAQRFDLAMRISCRMRQTGIIICRYCNW